MKAQEIRETFLSYFSQKGHKVVKSSSLLPKDDPTILFTNAGMNQFKGVFLGLEKKSFLRAVSIQKCLRVSGKHNDLETVGRTTKHHTFFEMLGNFSFGDYFKKEAIFFAWELITDVFALPKDRLFITVYNEDDHAYLIWSRDIGVPTSRIFRFGKADNFWAMGETGPCGPCSEIHYDLGSGVEEGRPDVLIANGSDRFVELWNLVFMEFNQDESGKLEPLPSPSIDTGMGMERMAAVLQNKKSNFETDLFAPLIESITEISGYEYSTEAEKDISVRIIADHVRAVAFLIGDGVTPANDGRGYVLRRLIRRAHRRGNLLGIDRPFLYLLVGRVGDIMREAYPELLSSMNYISRVCLAEEERFSTTLASGLKYFDLAVKETVKSKKNIIDGSLIFKLYDTFGFPLDLSQELAREKNLGVDEAGFLAELEKQKNRAREAWRGEEKYREQLPAAELKELRVTPRCYEKDELADVSVLALIKDGRLVRKLEQGDEAEVILSETPFYAEAGGAVSDTGYLRNTHFFAQVNKVYYISPDIISHRVKVVSGEVKSGQTVDAYVDVEKRRATSYNHTATHLLQAALRQVLGDHVKQAGSLVSPERLRFDFTHFSSLSKEELRRVEDIVNEKIRQNMPVSVKETSLEEGLSEGAIAVFEEKYGEKVRLVKAGDFSRELCGGIHVKFTGEIGLFKITSESSIAAGLRRIEAVTAAEALDYIWKLEELAAELEKMLSCSRKNIISKIEKLQSQVQSLEKELSRLRCELAARSAGTEQHEIVEVKEIPLLIRKVEGLSISELRDLADSLKQRMGRGAVILGGKEDDKVYFVVSVTKDLISRLKANELIKVISPIIDGGGGGRGDFAQAGGKKQEVLDDLLKSIPEIVEKIVS